MNRTLSRMIERHPVLREVALWLLPALVLGLVVRALLVSYLPYAFWGADSRSYFSFAFNLVVRHVVSLDQKRRYLYPLFLTPFAILPGTPLRWLALAQHALGLASLFPLGYVVRKTCGHWRWWIIPVGALYTCFPVLLWHEHELLGEFLYLASITWAFGGWVAWVSERRLARGRQLFWWFFVPLAVFMLTKPSARFAWPGLLAALVLARAWERLEWRSATALAMLFLASLTVGATTQGNWFLYAASFPLTRLETPLHAEYKAGIAERVRWLRQRLDTYYLYDMDASRDLENAARMGGGPQWEALGADPKLQSRIYRDLALEGIVHEPLLFLYFGAQRAVASSSLSYFRRDRFTGEYYRERTATFYHQAVATEPHSVRLAFGMPARGPLPPYETLAARLEAAPRDSWRAQTVQWLMAAIGDHFDFVRIPKWPREQRTLSRASFTWIGGWLAVAVLLSCFGPYRRTFGAWVLVVGSYLAGVFLVSMANPRYFAPAWPILIPLLALPADRLWQLMTAARRRWFMGTCRKQRGNL